MATRGARRAVRVASARPVEERQERKIRWTMLCCFCCPRLRLHVKLLHTYANRMFEHLGKEDVGDHGAAVGPEPIDLSEENVVQHRTDREHLQGKFEELRCELRAAQSGEPCLATEVNLSILTHMKETIPSVHFNSLVATVIDSVPWWLIFLDSLCLGLLSKRWMTVGNNLIEFDAEAMALRRVAMHRVLYTALRLRILVFTVVCVVFVVGPVQVAWAGRLVDILHSVPLSVQVVLMLLSLATYVVRDILPRKVRFEYEKVVGLEEGPLPSLMPLILEAKVPQFMISYAWGSRYLHVARQLSAVLPECWIDTNRLSPGDSISVETVAGALDARVLIILVTCEYIRSANCLPEICTAIRFRKWPQITIALVDDAACKCKEPGGCPFVRQRQGDRVCELLRRSDPHSVVTVRNVWQLLRYLDEHVLRATKPNDISTCVRWWQANGSARTHRVDASVRVVPPHLRKRLWYLNKNYSMPCRRRQGGVQASFQLLGADGRGITRWRLPTHHETTFFLNMGLAALEGLNMGVYCIPQVLAAVQGLSGFASACDPDNSGKFWTFTLVPFAMSFIVLALTPKLDPEQLHDPVLLPLLVAAHACPRAAQDAAAAGQQHAAALSAAPAVDLRGVQRGVHRGVQGVTRGVQRGVRGVSSAVRGIGQSLQMSALRSKLSAGAGGGATKQQQQQQAAGSANSSIAGGSSSSGKPAGEAAGVVLDSVRVLSSPLHGLASVPEDGADGSNSPNDGAVAGAGPGPPRRVAPRLSCLKEATHSAEVQEEGEEEEEDAVGQSAHLAAAAAPLGRPSISLSPAVVAVRAAAPSTSDASSPASVLANTRSSGAGATASNPLRAVASSSDGGDSILEAVSVRGDDSDSDGGAAAASRGSVSSPAVVLPEEEEEEEEDEEEHEREEAVAAEDDAGGGPYGDDGSADADDDDEEEESAIGAAALKQLLGSFTVQFVAGSQPLPATRGLVAGMRDFLQGRSAKRGEAAIGIRVKGAGGRTPGFGSGASVLGGGGGGGGEAAPAEEAAVVEDLAALRERGATAEPMHLYVFLLDSVRDAEEWHALMLGAAGMERERARAEAQTAAAAEAAAAAAAGDGMAGSSAAAAAAAAASSLSIMPGSALRRVTSGTGSVSGAGASASACSTPRHHSTSPAAMTAAASMASMAGLLVADPTIDAHRRWRPDVCVLVVRDTLFAWPPKPPTATTVVLSPLHSLQLQQQQKPIGAAAATRVSSWAPGALGLAQAVRYSSPPSAGAASFTSPPLTATAAAAAVTPLSASPPAPPPSTHGHRASQLLSSTAAAPLRALSGSLSYIIAPSVRNRILPATHAGESAASAAASEPAAPEYLSLHLRLFLQSHLCLVRSSRPGAAAARGGLDPDIPYASLAEALLDAVGRKVGSVFAASQRQVQAAAAAVGGGGGGGNNFRTQTGRSIQGSAAQTLAGRLSSRISTSRRPHSTGGGGGGGGGSAPLEAVEEDHLAGRGGGGGSSAAQRRSGGRPISSPSSPPPVFAQPLSSPAPQPRQAQSLPRDSFSQSLDSFSEASVTTNAAGARVRSVSPTTSPTTAGRGARISIGVAGEDDDLAVGVFGLQQPQHPGGGGGGGERGQSGGPGTRTSLGAVAVYDAGIRIVHVDRDAVDSGAFM